MIKLAAHLRHMQLYAHNAHNLCKGDTFFTDHPELGSLYSSYEDAYDGVVERLIGLGEAPNLIQVQKDAVVMLDSDAAPSGFNDAFSTILGYEEELCKLVDAANEGASLGTQNFVQGIADISEVRQYKLKQRLSKSSAKAEDSNEEKKAEVAGAIPRPGAVSLLSAPTTSDASSQMDLKRQALEQRAEGIRLQREASGQMSPDSRTLPPSQVAKTNNGYKVVTDARGNIVGTNAPAAAVGDAYQRGAINRGEGTMAEKSDLGLNIRNTALAELSRPAPTPMTAAPVPPAPTVPQQTAVQTVTDPFRVAAPAGLISGGGYSDNPIQTALQENRATPAPAVPQQKAFAPFTPAVPNVPAGMPINSTPTLISGNPREQPQIGGSNYAPNGQLQSAFQKAPDMNAMFKRYHGSSYDPNSSRDRKLYQQLQQLQSSGKPVNARTVYGRQDGR
jgi:DNA-binding ferritin-like protein